MDQYSERAKNVTADLESAISKHEQPAIGSAHNSSPASETPNPADALRLMAKTFEFTIETDLIKNITSIGTQTFNSLMKEQ